MYSILHKINEYPKHVQFTGGLYLLSIFGNTCCRTYFDAKRWLNKYCNNELNDFVNITDAWSAVKYGAEKNWFANICNSFIWPISITNIIIPWLVLQLNNTERKPIDTSKNDNDNDNDYKKMLEPEYVKPIPNLNGCVYNATEYDR